MTSSATDTSSLQRRLRLRVNESQVTQLTALLLQRKAQTTRLAGFRPGKVPMNFIAKQHGEQVRRQAVEEILFQAFQDKVREEKLRPTGKLRFEHLPSEDAGQLQVEAIFDVFPPIALKDLQGIHIRQPIVAITDADVDRALVQISQQQTTYHEVSRPAQWGDEVRVHGHFRLPEEPVEKAEEAKNLRTVLREGVSAELSQALLGLSAGMKKTIEIKYPLGGPESRLSGKMVIADLEVAAVLEAKVPQVDEDFAKKLGVADGSVEQLRKKIHDSLEHEAEHMSKNRVNQQIIEALLTNHDVVAPEEMVASETELLIANAQRDFASMGMTMEQQNFDSARAMAERRVKLGLLFAEISQTHELQPTNAQVMERIHHAVAHHPQHAELERKILADDNERNKFVTSVLETNVLAWAQSQMIVDQYPTTLQDLSENKGLDTSLPIKVD